jgi:hypothetical protein
MNSYDLLCLSRLYTWPGRLAFTLHISFLFCTILGRYVPYRGLAWSFGGLVWSSGVVLVCTLYGKDGMGWKGVSIIETSIYYVGATASALSTFLCYGESSQMRYLSYLHVVMLSPSRTRLWTRI